MTVTWKWGAGLGTIVAAAVFLAGTAVGVVGAQSPGETPTPTATPATGHCPYTDEEMAVHMENMDSHMEDMETHMQDMGDHGQDMGSHMQGGMGGGMMGGGTGGTNGTGTRQGGMGGGMMGGGMMGGGMMGR